MKATYTVRGPLPGIKSFTTSGAISETMAIQLAKPFVAAWRESVKENAEVIRSATETTNEAKP